MASPKKTKRSARKRKASVRGVRKFMNSYQSANLNDPKFSFLFETEPRPKCSFCKASLDSEKFFYKISKAATRKSVITYGDIYIKPETYLMCRQCWEARK